MTSRRLFKSLPVAPLLILLVFVVASLGADLFAPHDPRQQNILINLAPPSWLAGGEEDHLLGTDNLGRDILSNILYGGRVSLAVGFFALLISAAIGIPLGLVAGYFGGRGGGLIMRLADVQLALPTILVALVVLALLGAGLDRVILVIGVVGWAIYARVTRAAVIQVRERDFVSAAQALGTSTPRILTKHILPNALSPILVQLSVDFPRVVLLEATLSFLGLGVSVDTPSLGLMVAAGQNHLFSGAWWLSAFPGLALTFLVLSVNLIGDWVRDVFDPRLG
ncbi:MAG: ABC transporter permease [Deinococcota bacterium]|jgi:peptide/nickel transport system permease protein|nr:ABC transporter permease [Deinococcota bacterium]